jgi:predicted GIY-YIG superfamily endonuclease
MTDFTELDQKKPYGYIYKIDFPNDKIYIGLTISLEQRKKQHKSSANTGDTKYLYNALRKYNMVDTFELIVIDTADTEEELCEKEIMYIFEYNSYYKYGCGYNMTKGGEGTNGWVPTQEQKRKNSEAKKKYFQNNPEAGKEQSERVKKYYEDNPEAGKEQSERVKKYYEDNPEAKLKMSEIKKAYYQETPGAIEKNSEAIKKYFQKTPGAREKNREAQKKHYEDNPEAKLKMSEIMKAYYKEHQEASKNRLDTMGKNKPFDVLTKDGTIIKTFTYQMEAREYLIKEHNITSTIKISQVLNGKRNHSAGFVFKYKEN